LSPECLQRESLEEVPLPSTGKCAPIGVQASVKLHINVRPAKLVGLAASLAVQLGLTSVEVESSGVDDVDALRDKAAHAAFEDAHRQAELLATPSGQRLGRIVRMHYGADQTEIAPPAMVQPRVVASVKFEKLSESPLTPEVALELTPQDANELALITVVYELLK
jgi:uncharacterized protein YggE